MSTQLDENGYNRKPHALPGDVWYYEDKSGLQVYNRSGLVCVIPWRGIQASVKRHHKRKAKKGRP